MPPRIVPILDRLRQDHSALLAPAAIEDACRQEGYSWRKRLLDPVVTIYLFLLQILHGNTACQHVVQFGRWTFSDSAYCQARKRLPLRVFHRLLEWITQAGRRATASDHRWGKIGVRSGGKSVSGENRCQIILGKSVSDHLYGPPRGR